MCFCVRWVRGRADDSGQTKVHFKLFRTTTTSQFRCTFLALCTPANQLHYSFCVRSEIPCESCAAHIPTFFSLLLRAGQASQQLSEPVYEMQAVGACAAGFDFITNRAECDTAAKQLGLSDTSAYPWPSSDTPFGCYMYWKAAGPELFFNQDGKRNDDDTARLSICRRKCARAQVHSFKRCTAPDI